VRRNQRQLEAEVERALPGPPRALLSWRWSATRRAGARAHRSAPASPETHSSGEKHAPLDTSPPRVGWHDGAGRARLCFGRLPARCHPLPRTGLCRPCARSGVVPDGRLLAATETSRCRRACGCPVHGATGC
jgi:hypothetical protein